MFPQQLGLIAELREADREFDQICREVEEVAELLEGSRGSRPGPWEALQESLSGLQLEIAEYLAAGEPGC